MNSAQARTMATLAAAALACAGCATTGIPDAHGQRVLVLRAAPADDVRPDAGALFRYIPGAPSQRTGERIRNAAKGWADRHGLSVRRNQGKLREGVMWFAAPDEDGRLELVYRLDPGQIWIVLSHVAQGRRTRRRAGDAERLARQFAAPVLADAIAQALRAPEE